MNCIAWIFVIAVAVIENKSDGDGERKTADERVLNAQKSSSLPTNYSRDWNNEALMSLSVSEMCLPVGQQTSRSAGVVDVGLDFSQNSSTATSEFTQQGNVVTTLINSQGKVYVDGFLKCLMQTCGINTVSPVWPPGL